VSHFFHKPNCNEAQDKQKNFLYAKPGKKQCVDFLSVGLLLRNVTDNGKCNVQHILQFL
jgi:hypothetical protein